MKTLLTLLILSVSINLSVAQTQAPTRPSTWATPVDVKANLFQITPSLYRSEQPISEDMALIEQLNIKTVISFRAFHKDDKYFQGQPVRLIRIPIYTWSIKDKHVAEALWQMEQSAKNGPVLIHCMHGADRTGLIAAMYRIIYQDWEIAEAKRELMDGEYGYHSMWKNIEAFFTQAHVDNIKVLLQEKRALAAD